MRTVHGESFAGVTENDVRVFWRKRYYSCAADIGTDQGNAVLHEKYLKLLDNDTRGPCLNVDLGSVPFLSDSDVLLKSTLPIHDRCLNYTKELCLLALPLTALPGVPGVPANLTQESTFNFSDEDWDQPAIELPTPSRDTPSQKRAYGEINPVCQQFIGIVSANETAEHVDYALEVMYEAIGKVCQKIGCNAPAGRVVSSCMAKSKRRCTHGTDHRKAW
jgi:hypothetical protein